MCFSDPVPSVFEMRFFPFWSVGLMVQAQIQNPGTFDREA
jgi:hypothetical protein